MANNPKEEAGQKRPPLAQLLWKRRNDLRLSQGEVADALGLSRSYINLLERGLRKPSQETVAALANLLQISPMVIYQSMGIVPDDEPARLSSDEWELVNLYRGVTPPFRRAAIRVMQEGTRSLTSTSRG